MGCSLPAVRHFSVSRATSVSQTTTYVQTVVSRPKVRSSHIYTFDPCSPFHCRDRPRNVCSDDLRMRPVFLLSGPLIRQNHVVNPVRWRMRRREKDSKRPCRVHQPELTRTSPQRFPAEASMATVNTPVCFFRSQFGHCPASHLHHITVHSPSCCLPILLRDMRSRCLGPDLPVRLRSSSRSRALGKSWAAIRVSVYPHERLCSYGFMKAVTVDRVHAEVSARETTSEARTRKDLG